MNRDPKQVLTEWLVLAAQSGSEAAFKELHDLWCQDLRRLARARVERGEGVDEVTNDAWLSIARGLHRLEDPACFPRWAFRIVERRSADWVRQRMLARRREDAAQAEAERLTPAPPPVSEPADELQRVREAVQRLPPEQRQLVHLYYGLGARWPKSPRCSSCRLAR